MTLQNMLPVPFRSRNGETKAERQSRGAVLPFWELERAGRGKMQIHGAHFKFQVLFFLFLFCTIGQQSLNAQDSATVSATHSYICPDDLDAAKVDSFFKHRSIDLNQSDNADLYFEIFRWYKTCYRYGGNSNKGIDCSHFVNMLYEKLYGKTLGPSVSAIIEQCHIIKKGLKDAREGDLLFFKIKKGAPSHVGIYLQNGQFAHASTHNGVIISSMEEPYYKKRFYKVGRVK